jgi:hypothetical protein
MMECIEAACDRKATHVLVDYNHDVIRNGEVYCQEHAFMDGREQCPCCHNYPIKVEDDSGERIVLLPTYPAGTLDNEGCCSEHP